MRSGLTLAFSTRARGPHIGRYIRHLRRSCGLERVEILYRVNPGSCSLAELYNGFLDQAAHEVVCLLHDDLSFCRGSGWGWRILQAFARWPDYAVLGPAGSVSLDSEGLFWLPLEEMVGEVRHKLAGHASHNRYSERFARPLDVLVLDGILLAVHRGRIRTRFDTRIPGFHFYDMAFSLGQSLAHQRGEGGRCGVISGLGVTHRSGGGLSPPFVKARHEFLALYGSVLPRRIRPELHLRPLAGVENGPPVQIVIRYDTPEISLSALLQRLKTSAYRHYQLLVCNATDQVLPADIQVLETPDLHSWSALNQILLQHLAGSAATYVLLLESSVLPLQDWLPAMVLDFRRQPRLGTLGVRLHYPDTHLLSHNGLQIFYHPSGQPDVAVRGIHSPYLYRNALEWVPAGGFAAALMLRRELFIQLGGLAGQDWVPGLELNLRAQAAGWRNAVDSRLVGYRLAEEAVTEADYRRFLQIFAKTVNR
ncbi:MAG TPA: glycosyltransferase [Candidatus Obscuribacterales bacterium]